MATPDMGKMYGPLPLGAWLAVVAGGLGIALYTRRDNSTYVAEEFIDTSGMPGVGTGGSGIGWTPVGPPSTPPDDAVQGPPETNDEWARRAINYLIAANYDPATSDSAIRKYIGGESLSASEFALVNVALGKMGSPPIPLPPPLFAPPTIPQPPKNVDPRPKPDPVKPKPADPKPKPADPKPTPKPVKPSFKYHTVRPGDTLWGISKRYYGKHDWQRIYNANRKGTVRADKKPGMISNPNLIYPGWSLLIP